MSPSSRAHRRSPLCALLALLSGALLGGCHVGPIYQAPHAGLPEKWATDVPGALPTWPSADWWKTFGAPELDHLMEQARNGNPDVAAAVYRVREAQAQAEIAGAPLFPSIQAGATAGPQRQYSLNGIERNHVLYEGLISVRYELDFWGKNQAALEAARASADAARFAQQVVWITTSTGVATLYFQSLALLDRLQTARENLARAQHALDKITLAERQGTVPHLAVIQQQAAVAGIEALLPPLQGQLAAARNSLAILVGVLPEELQLTGHSLLTITQPDIRAGMPSELLSRRPDVQEAEASLVAANADIRIARAQFFPSIILPLDAGVESMTVPRGTVPPIGTYSLLAYLAQPIFRGGSLRGSLSQSEARYQELLVGSYRRVVLTAIEEVETALATVTASAAAEQAQERSAELAQRSAAVALASLHGGTGTTLDVLQSQAAVLAAQDAIVQARLAHLDALLSLIKALGGGWKLA